MAVPPLPSLPQHAEPPRATGTPRRALRAPFMEKRFEARCDAVLRVPAAPEWLAPIVHAVPLQLLAYYIAVRRGCDVDRPRNLAKSVTVE